MDKELLKGSIDIIIMALSSNKDVYGYEITRNIKEFTNSAYEMGEGTLYPALKRLEDKKFLTSYWGDSEKAGRRKYYKLTSLGKLELEQRLNNWSLIDNLIKRCVKGDIQ